jgi:dethiobiotin synthetase
MDALEHGIYRKNGLFIAGTDTGVGKTVVTAGLVRWARNRSLTAVAVKPVETGCAVRDGVLFPEDGTFLVAASEGSLSLDDCVPFRFSLPASPARAAAWEGSRLFMANLTEHVRAVASEVDLTIVEAAGGLMVPIEERLLMIDLIRELGCRVLLVGRTRLGTINHTLLSMEALQNRSIPVSGVILSQSNADEGPEEAYTPGDLARLLKDVSVVVLPHLDPQAIADPDRIAETMERSWGVDLLERWIFTQCSPCGAAQK